MTHDAQMLKGVLGLLLLHLLVDDEAYGYGIVTRLRELGFEDVAEGTVYPALTRLERAGHLRSRLVPSGSGPARKYYRATESGVDELRVRDRAWGQLVHAVAQVRAPLRSVATTRGAGR